MNYILGIRERRDGMGASWKCTSIHECFKLFDQIIGLHTHAYERNYGYILDKDNVSVIDKYNFKRHYKDWFNENVTAMMPEMEELTK